MLTGAMNNEAHPNVKEKLNNGAWSMDVSPGLDRALRPSTSSFRTTTSGENQPTGQFVSSRRDD